MCCNWNPDTNKCALHYGFDAVRGSKEQSEYAFSFVKNMSSVMNADGCVDGVCGLKPRGLTPDMMRQPMPMPERNEGHSEPKWEIDGDKMYLREVS